MKAKYQKYYDALKGANLSGGVSKISSAVNTAKTGLSSMQTSLSASSWSELGAMTVNSVTIPSLIQDLDLLNTNVTDRADRYFILKDKGGPYFAPKDGFCWSCGEQIYERISWEQARHELITGCPHCSRSYCD